jgi:3-oxoacyl-[acyl-carrier-protein] synthase-3
MRLGDGVTLASATTYLPAGRETLADMITTGRVMPADAPRLGVTEVPVSDVDAPELAVIAATSALAVTDCPATDVGVLVHAWTYDQGHDFWSPAHYIADQLGATQALPFGVQEMRNGGAVGIGLAATRLLADPDMSAALVTTADRFCLPGFDRWAGDYAVAYGDAGTALLLSRRSSAARGDLVLRTIEYDTAAQVESMHRGADQFSAAPLAHSPRIDIRRTKNNYPETAGEFQGVASTSVFEVVLRALSTIDVDPADSRIRHILLPRLSDDVLGLMYVSVLAGRVKGDVCVLRAGTGHLGCGDMAANLTHIVDSDMLDDGEFALVIGGGGGFTWSCAVVQRQ